LKRGWGVWRLRFDMPRTPRLIGPEARRDTDNVAALTTAAFRNAPHTAHT